MGSTVIQRLPTGSLSARSELPARWMQQLGEEHRRELLEQHRLASENLLRETIAVIMVGALMAVITVVASILLAL